MNRGLLLRIDWGLITPAIILVCLSLTALFSINAELFKSQLLFLILSILAFLFASQVNNLVLEHYSREIYITSIVLLLLVLLVGVESRGAVRWLEIFGFRIQFSELVKPFFAIFLSSYLTKNRDYSFKFFVLVIGLILPIAILVFLQPDLGNAVIYIIVTILTLIFLGFPLRFFFLSFGFIIATLPTVWNLLHQYQKQRVFSFVNPTDPLGLSYNAIQSSIAIGSGMILGRGFGEGTQSGLKFLPERHTDFIFATLAESIGFVGSVIVLLCFAFLLYRIFLVYRSVADSFCKIFCSAAFFLILSQFFINIAMNVGLLPIVGIALPFISYGGSSLLSNFILLGLLSSVARGAITRKVLEIR